MSSQPYSRGATVVAAALLLGGAFVVGTAYFGRQANAATPSLTLPTAIGTLPGSGSSGGSTGSGTGSGTGQGITVSGTSQVAGTPDTLMLSMSVTAQAGTISKAMDQANGAASRVYAALKSGGVAAKDLQTTNLQVQPNYSYPSNGNPVLDGYVVSESLSAKLRDLRRAGGLISAATAAGGNAARVDGIGLDLEDTGSLVSAARDKAVADARSKAEQYAKAVGRPLGPVTTLSETVAQPTPVDYSVRMTASAAEKAVPIQAGSQTVSVTVTVTYAFG
jgi:uncharacterized protein